MVSVHINSLFFLDLRHRLWLVTTVTRTFSIRLGQSADLSATMVQYCLAANAVSTYAFENKVWNATSLQKVLYKRLRQEFSLKSQMACSVFRHVAGTYTCEDKVLQKERRASCHVFKPTSMQLQYGKDFSFYAGNIVSVTSLIGRVKIAYKIGRQQRKYMNGQWEYGGATVSDRKGVLYLNVSVSREVAEVTTTPDNIVGVDLGQNKLAVATNKEGKALFVGGGVIKNIHRQTQRAIKSLKSKGTSSSRRRLRSMAGKQSRRQRSVNHCVSKAVVQFAKDSGHSIIGMEDLTGILNAPKSQRYRSEFHNWGFFQLRQFITYKAAQEGMEVRLIDPSYTSQACSHCGHTERSNRNGERFKCRACGYELHADLNAARNIACKTRLSRQDCDNQGSVNTPSMSRSLIQDATGEISGQAPAFRPG